MQNRQREYSPISERENGNRLHNRPNVPARIQEFDFAEQRNLFLFLFAGGDKAHDPENEHHDAGDSADDRTTPDWGNAEISSSARGVIFD